MRDEMTATVTVLQDAREIVRSVADGARDGVQQSAQEIREMAREAAMQARDQAREAAAQAREQAAQARDQIQQARELEKALSQQDATGETPIPGVTTIQTEDGKVITVQNGEPLPAAASTTQPIVYDGPPPGLVENVTGIMFGAVAGITAMVLVYRLLMKWLDNRAKRHQQIPDDTAQRLMRMEATIDSMAVEIERISEGQRFTSRLLADRTPVEVPRG
jgi:hypothetical protein